MFSELLLNLGLKVRVSLSCRLSFLICLSSTETVLLERMWALGMFFPWAEMSWHWAHCNHFSVTSVEQDRTSWKMCPWIESMCSFFFCAIQNVGHSSQCSTHFLSGSSPVNFSANILNSKTTKWWASCLAQLLLFWSLVEH